MLTEDTIAHNRQELRAVCECVEWHTYFFHDKPVVPMASMRGIEGGFCPVVCVLPLQTG